MDRGKVVERAIISSSLRAAGFTQNCYQLFRMNSDGCLIASQQRLANDQSELYKAYQGLQRFGWPPRKFFFSRTHIEGALEEICAYFNIPMVEILRISRI